MHGTFSPKDGILMAALGEDDLIRASNLVTDLKIIRFDCGHDIHIEKPKEFVTVQSQLYHFNN